MQYDLKLNEFHFKRLHLVISFENCKNLIRNFPFNTCINIPIKNIITFNKKWH